MISKEEIERKILELDKQIEIASKGESYSISSGLTSQSVKRQSGSTLLQMREYWLKKLEEAVLLESDPQSFRFVSMRGWNR